MNLRGAKVLVTGGSAGIGRATARLLAERGARVAISGRREDRLREAARATGAELPVVADVSREDDVRRMVQAVVQGLGGYDVLINNAGIGRFAPLLETTAEDMRAVWETNVLGAMLVARESARHFVAQKRGHIVNVASTAGSRAGPGGTIYASTKFALTGMTQSWRAELRGSNVRVMQINPSEVQTEFFDRAGMSREQNDTKLRGDEIAQVIASMLELDDRGMIVEASVWATNPKG